MPNGWQITTCLLRIRLAATCSEGVRFEKTRSNRMHDLLIDADLGEVAPDRAVTCFEPCEKSRHHVP